MFSVTGTVFLPGEPSSFREKSLKRASISSQNPTKANNNGVQAQYIIFNRLTELMSLSVSIVPLIRKKKALTASSLEESREHNQS